METTADDIRELVESLHNPKDKFAYQCLKRLEALSALSDGVLCSL